jgi:hypothetical protein
MPVPTFAISPLTLSWETPLLKAILEYHKNYETMLRAFCLSSNFLLSASEDCAFHS